MSNPIQWFPGHMAKTRRLIEECLPQVDIVVEICDARIPKSSRNPEVDKLLKDKKRVMLLNKASLADNDKTKEWCRYYSQKGYSVLACDCKDGTGIGSFIPMINKALANEREQWEQKGMTGRKIRLMVVGIPNVGKSTFINRIAKSNRAVTGDRPGVTRGKQWISIDKTVDMLDMPGMLWPKFEDERTGLMLSFCGSVKDEILDVEYVASGLLSILGKYYKSRLEQRYKLGDFNDCDGYDLLCLIGKKRGMLISGGEIDTLRAATMVLDEYRGGKLGKITLEDVSEAEYNGSSGI